MVKDSDAGAKKFPSIFPGRQNTKYISDSKYSRDNTAVNQQGSGSSMIASTPSHNLSTEIYSDNSLVSSNQSAFSGALDSLSDSANQWKNIDCKVTK